jgi:hypothetical protein
MRKRYKIVLNLELDDPDESYPAGGDYTHLSRLQRCNPGPVDDVMGDWAYEHNSHHTGQDCGEG